LYGLTPVVAAAAALVGVVFQKWTMGLRAQRKEFRHVPAWGRPALGGLITWVLSSAVFLQTGHLGVFGLGYDDLSAGLRLIWRGGGGRSARHPLCLPVEPGSRASRPSVAITARRGGRSVGGSGPAIWVGGSAVARAGAERLYSILGHGRLVPEEVFPRGSVRLGLLAWSVTVLEKML
jgi:hypothetical protein